LRGDLTFEDFIDIDGDFLHSSLCETIDTLMLYSRRFDGSSLKFMSTHIFAYIADLEFIGKMTVPAKGDVLDIVKVYFFMQEKIL
jgi:hypothetical protein